MSKKTKRQVTSSRAQEVTPAAPKAAAGSSSSGASGEFKPDYSYVISDLKKIGIMAGSFFLILVVLSFFLR